MYYYRIFCQVEAPRYELLHPRCGGAISLNPKTQNQTSLTPSLGRQLNSIVDSTRTSESYKHRYKLPTHKTTHLYIRSTHKHIQNLHTKQQHTYIYTVHTNIFRKRKFKTILSGLLFHLHIPNTIHTYIYLQSW